MARANAQVAGRTDGADRGRRPAPTYAGILKTARSVSGAIIRTADHGDCVDLCNAEGGVLLGWADPRVEAAVAAGGGHEGRAEAEAAERVGALIPSAEAVGFRASVGAAMADALQAAKIVTGRDGAFFCDDETTAGGDTDAIESAFDRHSGRIAALVVRPMEATRGFLTAARRSTAREGALLILDESRTAFRLHAGGAQALHGVTPDITVLGASLANGRPIAAIAGRVEPMRAVPGAGRRVAGPAIAAVCATLSRVERDDVPDALRLRGAEIEAEVDARLRQSGADVWLGVYGDPTWSLISAHADDGIDGEALEAALATDLAARGVLSFGAHVPSLATNDQVVARLLDAYDAALPRLVDRAHRGEFAPRLRRSALAQ